MSDTVNVATLLRDSRTVAVVGLSPKENRPSHLVAKYLQQHGFRIIPVNPAHAEILGEKCYPDLASISEPVDIVDVFRRPDECVQIARGAVTIRARVLWMQIGVVNNEARRLAEDAGLTVVMDHCIKVEHSRLQDG